MDFKNLVVAQSIGGLPSLTNAGNSRLKGVELSAAWQMVPHVFARATYSFHDGRFVDYLRRSTAFPPSSPASGSRCRRTTWARLPCPVLRTASSPPPR